MLKKKLLLASICALGLGMCGAALASKEPARISYIDPGPQSQPVPPLQAQPPLPTPTKRPGETCSWEEIGEKYYVNPSVLYAIAVTESSLNPNAVNRANKNGTEDVGMMQINSWWFPKLKRDFGISRQDLFDPCVSLDVGAWVLADNMRRLGNTWNAIGAYNAVTPSKRRTYAERVYANLPN